MTRRKRTILALVLLELFLAGLWYYLASAPGASPDSGRVIGETMGIVMGVVLGLAPVLYLLARSNDRKAAAKKGE
jgi:peptidoglycan/LPS O-acetylase OafA/YrhL